MHKPQDPRLPGDYSHILPPEKPTAAKSLGLNEVTESQFPTALSREQLNEIQARNKGNEDMKALLWEVKRLRTHVLRMDQVLRSSDPTLHSLTLQSLARDIQDEPCIQELRREWSKKLEAEE
jgi:hypothetical protein